MSSALQNCFNAWIVVDASASHSNGWSKQRSLRSRIPGHRSGPRREWETQPVGPEFSGLEAGLQSCIVAVPVSALGHCPMCLKNGHPPQVYQTHNLRHPNGTVACPFLRAYKCSLCHNRGGDYAHTLKYCPLSDDPKQPNLVRHVRMSVPREHLLLSPSPSNQYVKWSEND